jgi:hypothetical protein
MNTNMKLFTSFSSAVLLLFPAASLLAQTTGTSTPPPVDYSAATNSDAAAARAGSAPPPVQPATPASAPTLQQHAPEVVYGPYIPYVTPAQVAQGHQNNPSSATDGGDGGIAPPSATDNLLPEGTQIEAFLQSPISTQTSLKGAQFTAVINADIVKNGVVVLPAGSLIKGRLTHVNAGHHGIGPAAIHLHPDSISTLDGTGYALKAEVTALDHFKASHVNEEGTIVSNSSGKDAAIAFGVTTGTAVVSGAIVGGGVGAAVGLGVGAGIATVWYFKHDHHQTLPAGTEIVFTLQEDLQLNPATH